MNHVDLTRIVQNVKTYEMCDCYTLGEQPICGCGKHELRLYREEVIHWLGQHWAVKCAFENAIDGLSRAFDIFKYIDEDMF